MASSYQHKPLKAPSSIRVLTLEPSSSRKAPIQCSLGEVDLDNLNTSSSYEALSYVWGDGKERIPILCHGKPLLVTLSCFAALIWLRRSFQRRRLFIDAICIDQRQEEHSLKERGQQVKLMGQVYQKAERVVIWLGLAHPSTRQLFQLMQFTASHGADTDAYWKPRPLNKLIKPMVSLHDHINKERGMVRDAFLYLAINPWFTRVWTMQEQIFTREDTCLVVCGRHQISYAVMTQAMASLVDMWPGGNLLLPNLMLRNTLKTIIEGIYRWSRLNFDGQIPPLAGQFFWHIHKSHSLPFTVEVLGEIRNLKTTLPQDKIFGLHSVFSEVGVSLPDPDYSKPVAEVFESTTRAMIQFGVPLDFLVHCTRAENPGNLPSWVVNWSTEIAVINTPDLTGWKALQMRKYKAARDTVAIFGQTTEPGKISLRGVIIGKVDFVAVSSVIGSQENHQKNDRPPFYGWAEACRLWCKRIASRPSTGWSGYRETADAIEAAARMLFNQSPLGEIPYSDPTQQFKLNYSQEWFDLMLYPNCKMLNTGSIKELAGRARQCAMQKASYTDYDANVDLSVEVIAWIIYSFSDSQSKATANRIVNGLIYLANYGLMILDSGHLARGWHVCRQGDTVCILAGLKCPIAIRPDGKGNFRFVAPLYVDGIMGGEVWPEDESQLEEIVLV